jgi:hypothetical protein
MDNLKRWDNKQWNKRKCGLRCRKFVRRWRRSQFIRLA